MNQDQMAASGEKAINTLTGEIIEIRYNTFTEFQDQWLELTRTIQALERLKDKMKESLLAFMGEEDKTPEYNGFQFKRTYRAIKEYDPAVLREHLNEDVLFDLMKPDKKAVDEYLKEAVAHNDIDPAVSRAIRDSMTVKSSSVAISLVATK